MKTKAFILLGFLFALVLLVSSTDPVQTSKDEKGGDKAPQEYHVRADGYGYGGGGWGGYGGGGWGGRGGGGGWGGYGGEWGGKGGGYGGGGWGGRGGGYGGGGWGGRGGGYGGGGWGGGGCRLGCCGEREEWGCRRCCRSLTEAMIFNENEATP